MTIAAADMPREAQAGDLEVKGTGKIVQRAVVGSIGEESSEKAKEVPEDEHGGSRERLGSLVIRSGRDGEECEAEGDGEDLQVSHAIQVMFSSREEACIGNGTRSARKILEMFDGHDCYTGRYRTRSELVALAGYLCRRKEERSEPPQ